MLLLATLAAAMRLAPLRMSARLAPLRMSELPLADKWAVQKLKDGVRVTSKDLRFRTEDESIEVPRSLDSPGIGLALEEVGSDGTVGLVLVDSVVDGGNAASTQAFLPGDALISVQDSAGTVEVALEGATYDATVEALGSLDPALGSLIFTVRRLVRQPVVSVRLQFPGEEGRADEQLEMLPGQPLRQTILSRGIKLNDPLALRFDSGGPGDCGGEGCCCTCAVQVVAGLDALNEQKSQERQMLKKHADWRLGCRAAISPSLDADSELVIRASPRNWNSRELLADVDECEVVEGGPV
jgi:ferredoxin